MEMASTPNYFDWREIFPELRILIENLNVIKEEAQQVPKWTNWPEDHYNVGGEGSWTVFPLLHTFPAFDQSKMKWLDSTCKFLPHTTQILKQIPNVRTALFSRLMPGTELSSHRGWADLANYVLRCHLCLTIPTNGDCGMIVNNEIQLHKQDEILVFDDSKYHKAFNGSADQERIILIVDILRPPGMPEGEAKGGHTNELDSFVERFN